LGLLLDAFDREIADLVSQQIGDATAFEGGRRNLWRGCRQSRIALSADETKPLQFYAFSTRFRFSGSLWLAYAGGAVPWRAQH
jgi:hypothetical protein